MTHDHGKSDNCEVPAKFANNGDGQSPAERDGGKAIDRREQVKQNTTRTQKAAPVVPSALDRVRKIAASDKKTRFTSLLHHIYDINRLRTAFFAMKRSAAAGVDGETWTSYEENLEENLRDLSQRLKAGGYQAKPVRRVFIAKADGKQRPLGVPTVNSYCTSYSAG